MKTNLRKVRVISREKSEMNSKRGRELKKTLVVLIDTNFILTCIRQKIDFFEWFKLNGISVIIPIEVINELKMLAGRSKDALSLESKFAMKLLKNNKFQEIGLEGGDCADKVIVNHARKHPDLIIATLDKEMRDKIKNKKVTIRQGKVLEII